MQLQFSRTKFLLRTRHPWRRLHKPHPSICPHELDQLLFALNNDTEKPKMHLPYLVLALFAGLSAAQFQFFEQMFGGQQQHHQGHQHQEKQNVASDSEWYQRTYDGGTSSPSPPLLCWLTDIASRSQPIAATISAHPPSHVSTSRTTAPAPTQIRKTKSSWVKGAQFVHPRVDSIRTR